MKEFKKLESGVFTHIDKKGHIHVFSEEEFNELNNKKLVWLKKLKKYFRL